MENNSNDEQTQKIKYNKLSIILILLLICFLSYLVYSFYNNYKTTIADYENQINNLHSTINSKTQSLKDYRNEVYNLNKQIEFMNNHVAICPLDGSGLYHRYGCEYLDTSHFMIYNTEQAPNEGYSPCYYCFGESNNLSDDTTQIVYITNTGSKYHRAGCSYLKSKKAITKEQAVSQGYSPCSRCNP